MLGWKDGQPYSDRYGDVYFSADSGLEETRHVFLRGNRLAERFRALPARASFCIGETGFGTGLNFLAAWQAFEEYAPAGASLDFFSVEATPLDDDELGRALRLWPELTARSAALLARWRRRVPHWNRWSFAGGRVRATVAICDVADALPQLPAGVVDAWFLDGFAPAKNPEMWSDAVLAHVARATRGAGTLSTYTSAGGVRRGLQQAGFAIERAPGFGRKREMVQGVLRSEARSALPAASPAPGRHPASTLVIGGGVAGCAAAYALARRGVRVELIERAPRLAAAASGNPRGILYARLGASAGAVHRFVLAAYGHALGLLDDVLPVDRELRGECGLLQLAFDDAERKRIARLAAAEWPAHLVQFVDDRQASELVGIVMTCGGAWFPAGGWVVPAALAASLASDARIALRPGHAVETLERTATGWRVGGHDTAGNRWFAEPDVVLACCGSSARSLAPFADLPLTAVRGQISLLPATDESGMLRTVVCGDGYCTPESGGMHLAGATHGLADESTDVRRADHVTNLSNLARFAPQLRDALGEVDPDRLGGRASVRCSAPGAMPLAGSADEGLYCSLAHGTRGMITAGLAGEVLAAQICGQLPPLPANVLTALAPLRRARGASTAQPADQANVTARRPKAP